MAPTPATPPTPEPLFEVTCTHGMAVFGPCWACVEKAAKETVRKVRSAEADARQPLQERIRELESALAKINEVRNSIIGLQTVNWSEHIYPLVAAINEAGFEGMEYPAAREQYGTMLERTNAAEKAVVDARQAAQEEMRSLIEVTKKLRAALEAVENENTTDDHKSSA